MLCPMMITLAGTLPSFFPAKLYQKDLARIKHHARNQGKLQPRTALSPLRPMIVFASGLTLAKIEVL